jgi:hypothetical protein
MELTGKCKQDFEKFLIKIFPELGIIGTNWNEVVYEWFMIQNSSMQYGVLVDFFDSVGIRIDLISVGEPTMGGFNFFGHRFLINGFKANLTYINTRPEARDAAIEKANELYNKI